MNDRRIKQIVKSAILKSIKKQYDGFSEDEIAKVEEGQKIVHSAINIGHDLWELSQDNGDKDKQKAWEEIITTLRNVQNMFDKVTKASWVREPENDL